MPQKTSRWWVAVAVVPLLTGVLGSAVLERGRARRSDGIPMIARITRTEDGSCWFGAKRHHCYRLSLEVFPTHAGNFLTSLDVNVEDQWASRVQPGSLVWVVQTESDAREVALAIDAFSDPPPSLP